MYRTNRALANRTTYLVTTSLFSALIFLTIAYILHIPIGNGYVHIGDAFIYLAAAILPTPYAIACAAIGAGLADLATGYAIWVIPTIIIKPILVLFITSEGKKIINIRNIVGTFTGGFVGWFLYALAQGIITGSFIGAFVINVITLLQPIGSFIVFIILGITFDKLEIKQKF
ncbi:MAG: TIGR04002 family protein [Peptostreptococcaceae bacterium]